MTTLSFTEMEQSPIQFVGALDFDRRQEGLSPRRLPEWTRPQVPAFMDTMVRMPSGVRLSFRTDSTSIEVVVLTTRMVMPPRQPRPVAFDLVINAGAPVSKSFDAGNTIVLDPDKPGEFELQRGAAYSVRFDGLPDSQKNCELWLPHNTFVELRSLSIDDNSTLTAPAPSAKRRWLHYGSSISHCVEADAPTNTWPAVAARLGEVELHNLGFGGNCHLDQFVARTIRDQAADLISLKVGINIVNMDSMRERVFIPALHGFIDTVREGHPDTPLMVVSPILCPSAEDVPGPTRPDKNGRFVTYPGHDEIREGCMALKHMRELIADLIDGRQKRGDENLSYLSGLSLFGENDKGDLPDDLHPNPAGYIRMGERFAKYAFAPGAIWAR